MIIKSVAISFVALLGILIPLERAMAGGLVKVAGSVEAVDVSARPQTFVIKTTTAGRKELIVGCRLDDKTVVRAGRHAGKLENFRAGDRAQLIYLRVDDGLVCRKISKKRKE